MPGRIVGKESGEKNFAKNHGGKRCRGNEREKIRQEIRGENIGEKNMANKHGGKNIFFKKNGITMEF